MPGVPFSFRRSGPPSPLKPTPTGVPEPKVWSVSALTRQLRFDLERQHGDVTVGGEISNLTVHGVSGHAYFTLKDAEAQLKAVMWRDSVARLRFRLADGQ